MKLEMLDNYKGEELKTFNKIKNDPRLHSISETAIRVMFNRGLRTVEDMEKHIFSNLNHLHDSMLLPDADKFCEIVARKIKEGAHIVDYTDYDCDGIGSGLTCLHGLRKLIKNVGSTSEVHWYANNRFIEGYGMTVKGVEDLVSKFPDVGLIITTDNGIMAFDAIERAKELGVDVVVTDHHRTLIEDGIEKLPKALAVVDPHRLDSQYPFPHICGAGVIFKLLLALSHYLNQAPEEMYDLLDFVGMATVGDMMPLIDENRIFVKESLSLVKNENRKAFEILRKELEEESKKNGKTRIINVNEELFGFTYCPMLNALGRLNGSIDEAMELFQTNDEKRMKDLVKYIMENNEKRKKMTEEQTATALEKIEKMGKIPDVLVVYDESFSEGIVGLIAGRLKEQYNRPSIVFGQNEGKLKGSARSIDGVNMIESLYKLPKELLISCGGHPGAAGLSIPEDEFERFQKEINQVIELSEDQREKKIGIDAALPVSQITEALVDNLELLKPFGEGFSKPRFGLQGFVADIPATGNPYRGQDKMTVRLVNNSGFTVIMFKHPESMRKIEHKFENKEVIKCIGYPSINVFNGKTSMQMLVEEGLMF